MNSFYCVGKTLDELTTAINTMRESHQISAAKLISVTTHIIDARPGKVKWGAAVFYRL